MTLEAVWLDTGPLGLVTQKPGKSATADACRHWMLTVLGAGIRIYVAEIVDYEVRRELIRLQNAAGLERLDALHDLARYVPLTTEAMREAARLWAQVRIEGKPTADPYALDADVILAAQALTSVSPSGLVVATTNVSHLARFVPALEWATITS